MNWKNMKAGIKIPVRGGSYLKVMAIADGYVMARYKGCAPFCESVAAFKRIVSEQAMTPEEAKAFNNWKPT